MNAISAAAPNPLTRERRYDPRAILIAFLCMSIWISYATDIVSTAAGLGLATILLMIPPPQGARWHRFLTTFRWAMLFAAVVLVLYVLMSKSDEPAWLQLGPVTVTRSAFHTGLRLGLTFVAFVVLARSLLLYATPSGLAAALTWLLGPLRLIGLKPEMLYSLVFIILRLIPGLVAESRTIRFAHRSRGWQASRGSWSHVRDTRAIIIPVFAAAMRRADSLSMVLTSRGINLDDTPGAVRMLRFQPLDYVILIVALVVTVAGLYLQMK